MVETDEDYLGPGSDPTTLSFEVSTPQGIGPRHRLDDNTATAKILRSMQSTTEEKNGTVVVRPSALAALQLAMTRLSGILAADDTGAPGRTIDLPMATISSGMVREQEDAISDSQYALDPDSSRLRSLEDFIILARQWEERSDREGLESPLADVIRWDEIPRLARSTPPRSRRESAGPTRGSAPASAARRSARLQGGLQVEENPQADEAVDEAEGGEPDEGGGDGEPVSSGTPPLLRPLRAFDPSMFMDDGDDTPGLLAAATFISALGDYVGCGEPGGAHAAQATLLMKHLRSLAVASRDAGPPDDMSTIVAVWRRCLSALGSFRRSTPNNPKGILNDIKMACSFEVSPERARLAEGSIIHREVSRLGYLEVETCLAGYARSEWGPPLDRLIHKYDIRGDPSGPCYYRSRIGALNEKLVEYKAHISGVFAQVDSRGLNTQDSAEAFINELTLPAASASAAQEPGGPEPMGSQGQVSSQSGNILRGEAIVRAHNQPAFVETVENLREVDFPEQPLEVWDLVFRARSAVLTRFGLRLDPILGRTHPIYGSLLEIKHERIHLFARAQANCKGDGVYHPRLDEWKWRTDQFNLFAERRYEKLDLVSHDTGFLGPLSLKEATPISPVPKRQHFRVESVVEGARDFFHATCVQAGYSDSCDHGLTAHDYFTLHADNLRWARSQGDRFAGDLIEFVVQLFVEGLELAGVLARAKDDSSSPADVVFSYFLPANCPYVRLVNQKREQLEPLRTLRDALGSHFLPCSAPRCLPGVVLNAAGPTRPGTHPFAGREGHAPGGEARPPARDAKRPGQAKAPPRAPSKPKGGGDGVHPPLKQSASKPPSGKAVAATPPAAPGSKSWLTHELPSGELIIGSTVFDVPAVASHFGVGVKDRCWPVCLTVKTGAAALSVCPHHKDAAHAHMRCPLHRPPAGFSLDQVIEKFSRPANEGERAKIVPPSSSATATPTKRKSDSGSSKGKKRAR